MNSHQYPPPPSSVQFHSSPTGGSKNLQHDANDNERKLPAAPSASTDNAAPDATSTGSVKRQMPSSTTKDDDSRTEMDEDDAVEESSQDLRDLSLNEDEDVDQPSSKKARGADDFVMDTQDDVSDKSPTLLDDSNSVESMTEYVRNSQEDRFGLVILCADFITLFDARKYLTPHFPCESDATNISLCLYEGRFGILVTGPSLMIKSTGNSLENANLPSILGHSIEMESLCPRDWTNIVPVAPNTNAEQLASESVVDHCKRSCRASQFKRLASAINSSSSAAEVFNFFLGIHNEAQSNTIGTKTQA